MAEESKSTQNQNQTDAATEPRAASAPSSGGVTLRTAEPNRVFVVGETRVTREGVKLSASEAEKVEEAAKKSNVPVERV